MESHDTSVLEDVIPEEGIAYSYDAKTQTATPVAPQAGVTPTGYHTKQGKDWVKTDEKHRFPDFDR